MFRRCLFPVVFILLVVPVAFAQQEVASEEAGQEASASQAQATMASLFGRGAKMPGIPRINGTIALPAFDNADMKIDEGSLNAAQQQRSE
jgi:hypothetical protein